MFNFGTDREKLGSCDSPRPHENQIRIWRYTTVSKSPIEVSGKVNLLILKTYFQRQLPVFCVGSGLKPDSPKKISLGTAGMAQFVAKKARFTLLHNNTLAMPSIRFQDLGRIIHFVYC